MNGTGILIRGTVTMKHREVVANFIFKWSNDEETQQQVALFQRSSHPNVRSYQGKYAPISGSVDGTDSSPEVAAVREIREETQLIAHQDLVFGFCGKSFSFIDEQAQRSWTVYPFGWMLNADESRIMIDWEHSGWEWFDPQQVLDGTMSDKCVPNIHKSLERVYFGPNGMFRGGSWLVGRGNSAGVAFLETIEALKTNTKDGARVLATGALKGLMRIAECFKGVPSEGQQSRECWHALRVAAYHLIYSSRPSMNAAISAAVLEAMRTISEDAKEDQLHPQAACDTLHASISERLLTSKKVAQAFSTFIGKEVDQVDPSSNEHKTNQGAADRFINIITISMSSTILAAIKQLMQDGQNKSVINLTVLESRPACEGATLAASLIKSIRDSGLKPRLNVRIAPESHGLLLMEPKSIVLLGADRITSTGHVINKTGSAQLALVASAFAKSRGCKVVVLSEEDKIAKPDTSFLERYSSYVDKQGQGSLHDNDRQELAELSEKELHQGHIERHDAAEVYGAWPGETLQILQPYIDKSSEQGTIQNTLVEVENIYFETIDQAHINYYISENGEISRSQILHRSIARAKIEEELFADLYD